MFKNNLAWPVNLVRLAWTSRSQYYLKITFLSFTSNLAKFQWKDLFKWLFLAFLSENIVQCPKKVIFMSVIYLHFSNGKFMIFCSMDWFRFKKNPCKRPITYTKIPRFLEKKRLGWFLGFQSNTNPWAKTFRLWKWPGANCKLPIATHWGFWVGDCGFF